MHSTGPALLENQRHANRSASAYSRRHREPWRQEAKIMMPLLPHHIGKPF